MIIFFFISTFFFFFISTSLGAVWSGSTLFVCIQKIVIDVSIYMQQMTSADSIFRCIFFFVAEVPMGVACQKSMYAAVETAKKSKNGTFTNSVDPDKTPQDKASHQGLHYFPC